MKLEDVMTYLIRIRLHVEGLLSLDGYLPDEIALLPGERIVRLNAQERTNIAIDILEVLDEYAKGLPRRAYSREERDQAQVRLDVDDARILDDRGRWPIGDGRHGRLNSSGEASGRND